MIELLERMGKRDPSDWILTRDECPKLYDHLQTINWVFKGMLLVATLFSCFLPASLLMTHAVTIVKPFWLENFYSVGNNYRYFIAMDGLSIRYIISLAAGIYILVASLAALCVLFCFLLSSELKPLTAFQVRASVVNVVGFAVCICILLCIEYGQTNVPDEVSFWRKLFSSNWVILSNSILVLVAYMTFSYVLIATAKLIKSGGRVDHKPQ
ncbi:hypothetical protein NKH99_27690 [Mesorhizobium sp. M0854]|uniref:hypothetical protein n=1 Tax=Mesorhizobium sp. M0854 TaxID=2957013 RepID=UPI0033373DC2